MMLGTNFLEKLKRDSSKSEIKAKDHLFKGRQFAEQDRYPEALAEFKEAVRSKSDCWEAQLELGATYHKMGRINQAIKAYLAALEEKSDIVEAYRNLGVAYDALGEFVRALKMYCKAILLRPNDLELRKNLGLAYFNIGSYAEAIKAYQQALAIDPHDASVHYYLGLVYLDLEDKEKALQEHQLLKELSHDDVATQLLDEIDRQSLRGSQTLRRAKDTHEIVLDSRSGVTAQADNSAGFSLLELLIVVAMVGILVGFALIQIVRANQQMKRANAAQQFAAYLEKARLDSLRRHPTATAQMAQVSIINAGFYSVAIDSTGDGTLDAPQVISLPANSDFQFNGPFPRTIYFNWRGRTVDDAGAPANPSFVTISSANYGESRIDLTSSGQPSLSGPPVSSPVVNSAAPAPVYRTGTQIP